jgi:transcriptional regulator with XRE-family HTH domain
MGRCTRLKFNRRKLGLSQKEFAEKVGLSVGTISRLELDETAWNSIQNSTFDKINSIFEDNELWKIMTTVEYDKNKENVEEEQEEVDVKEVLWADRVEVEPKQKKRPIEDDVTLKLLEFIMDGLRESETHEEFEANLKLLKRIMKDD